MDRNYWYNYNLCPNQHAQFGPAANQNSFFFLGKQSFLKVFRRKMETSNILRKTSKSTFAHFLGFSSTQTLFPSQGGPRTAKNQCAFPQTNQRALLHLSTARPMPLPPLMTDEDHRQASDMRVVIEAPTSEAITRAARVKGSRNSRSNATMTQLHKAACQSQQLKLTCSKPNRYRRQNKQAWLVRLSGRPTRGIR